MIFTAITPAINFEATAEPGSVPAGDSVVVTLTVPQALPEMMFVVSAPDLEADLVMSANIVCSTIGEVDVLIFNPTGAPIVGAEQTFKVIAL